jgi:ribonuclease HII
VPEHLEALARLGPTVHHRRFFAPVAAARERHQGPISKTGVVAIETRINVGVSASAV